MTNPVAFRRSHRLSGVLLSLSAVCLVLLQSLNLSAKSVSLSVSGLHLLPCAELHFIKNSKTCRITYILSVCLVSHVEQMIVVLPFRMP